MWRSNPRLRTLIFGSEFVRVCERRKLRVNVGKSKVIYGSNARDAKRRTVRGSGFFKVPMIASDS